MSLRESQHMSLDTDSSTHTGMEGQSRSSHRYLLLQLWCGLLTVSVVVMAVLIASNKPKSAQEEDSTMKPDNVSTTGTASGPLKSTGTPLSYIQLSKAANDRPWDHELPSCDSCSLVLRNNSIHCTKNSKYFIYAQVTFRKTNQSKSVVLKRDQSVGRSMKKLAVGTFSNTMEGSVWVAKIVSLTDQDTVSLDISGEVLTEGTVWGAFELH